MKIKTFKVEQWMNEYENDAKYNLAETCVDSLTIGELLNLAEKEPKEYPGRPFGCPFDIRPYLRLPGAAEGDRVPVSGCKSRGYHTDPRRHRRKLPGADHSAGPGGIP